VNHREDCGFFGGAVAQLGARLDGIEEVVGSNPIGSTNSKIFTKLRILREQTLRQSMRPYQGRNNSALHRGAQ
jgi:hypothetical protein